MDFRTSREDGETRRKITLFDTTYDLSDYPATFFLATVSALFLAFSVIYVVLKAVSVAYATAQNMYPLLPEALLSAVAIWVGLGLIKYKFTGSSKPFFTINFSLNGRTVSTEKRNTE